MQNISDNLIQVLEDELGPISTSIKCNADENVQLVLYESGEWISSLGLHRLEKVEGITSVSIGFEWLMSVKNNLDPNPAFSMLDYYISKLIQREMSTPERGSYIKFDRSIWKGDNSVGIYFTASTFASDQFSRNLGNLNICPIWVVPLNGFECDILEKRGWPQLEEYWDNNPSIDVADPFRNSNSIN